MPHGIDDFWKQLPMRSGILQTRGERKQYATVRRRLAQQIKDWQLAVDRAAPTFSQCQHLVKKFGGVMPFSVACKTHPETIITCWLSGARSPAAIANHKYTDGLVPGHAMAALIVSSRYFGVLLSPQDLYPDFIDGNETISVKKELKIWIRSVPRSLKMRELEDHLASWVSTPE